MRCGGSSELSGVPRGSAASGHWRILSPSGNGAPSTAPDSLRSDCPEHRERGPDSSELSCGPCCSAA
eukprot:6652532-Alexandrium_andersonii.AAC.1